MSTEPRKGSATRIPSGATEALLGLAEAVGRSTTLTEICDAALDGIQLALAIERSAILLFDPDGVMRFKAWRGLSETYRAAVEGHTPWTPNDVAPPPVVVPDVRADRSLERFAAAFERERIAALAFFPLLSRSRVIGTFMLYCESPHDFSGDEVNLALTIGHYVGFALERTRSELESRTNHQRLLFALDAGQMGTWEWDVRTQRVRWSENLERIHGLRPGTFDGQFTSYEREIHPDDRGRVFASIQHALAADAIHDIEYRIVTADGTIRWVHGKGRVERDADGRPSVMSGVCMDISARKRAELDIEAALRHEAAVRDRLTVLTNGSQELLTTLDGVSVVAQVLALARRVVAADGYAVWRRDGTLWRVAASEGLSEGFTSIDIQDAPQFRFDLPIIAEDVMKIPTLETRWGAYAVESIRSLVTVPLIVRGELAGSIAFYYRSAHSPGEVEVRVAIALGQLAAAAVSNAELYAEAQQANRLKDEFLATLSHELRTPLNVILGRARMLQSADDPGAVRAGADAIQRNGAALTRLVEDLLDLSSITQGRLRLESAPVYLNDVVEAAVQGIQPAAAAKAVVLRVDANGSVPPIVGDATRLQQVIWNLLVNAVKFTPSGGIVTVRVAVERPDLVLQVVDTGSGIDSAFLPHIFDMFHQAPASNAVRQQRGLGLGLSIVRRLVELHGGTVAAHSEGAGRGATFTVRLPLSKAEAGEPAAVTDERSAAV